MKLVFALVIFLVSVPLSAAEVSPFGLHIGEATIDQVRAEMTKRGVTLTDTSRSSWTNGPLLQYSGDGFGIEGMSESIFIFNKQNRLVAITSTVPKRRYRDIKAYLDQKYPLVRSKDPHVGDRLAIYRVDDVEIRASAPHLSFEMSLQYLHQSFLDAFNAGQQKEEREKAQQESSEL